jgi:cysteine synthase
LIDLTVNEEVLRRAAARVREQNIVIPTFEQMRHPDRIPESVKAALGSVGLWDVDPLNLFRITWHNEPVESGGGFGPVNYLEFPSELTGIEARVIAIVGKWFPTGAHKVGAAFGCLAPRLVTGQFDPGTQKAVWPSTGNYCRGGAYDSQLLATESIAILPEGMSRERFEWLETVAGEIIRTPGTEANVKEIFDKCNELRASGEDLVIFNQFDEFGNYLWHYGVTGPAIVEVLEAVGGNYRGLVSATGSAGTIAAGDYLKQWAPTSKIAAGEALQVPTLTYGGYGDHRIEGIGDKHVPWIHNVRNTDIAIGVNDEAPMALLRLFNEDAGREYLETRGVSRDLIGQLDLLGISGIANVLGAMKLARYYELGSDDVVVTILTDSMEMYGSRLEELHDERGEYTTLDASGDYHQYLMGADIEHVIELGYWDRKRVHNLKYFTWVEQQGKTARELDALWDPSYWEGIQQEIEPIDTLIEEFNALVAGS